ncbi:hypothetical protein RIF29_10096 [Crotalaria pallida]|uniref:Uncharacterized protein n=1 Tax=Crotalaria pallida TaxID=3830 RepID=A0AAN9FUX7_CROPI
MMLECIMIRLETWKGSASLRKLVHLQKSPCLCWSRNCIRHFFTLLTILCNIVYILLVLHPLTHVISYPYLMLYPCFPGHLGSWQWLLASFVVEASRIKKKDTWV